MRERADIAVSQAAHDLRHAIGFGGASLSRFPGAELRAELAAAEGDLPEESAAESGTEAAPDEPAKEPYAAIAATPSAIILAVAG